MRASDFIKHRQILWAERKGIRLQGSKRERGEPAYTATLANNLYRELTERGRTDISQGDGSELKGSNGNPPKMYAVHSTTALYCNVFDYWLGLEAYEVITSACKRIPTKNVQRIAFEHKLPVLANRLKAPNIDIMIEYAGNACKGVGIECKFSEPYSPYSRGVAPRGAGYLKAEPLWRGLNQLRKLEETLVAGKKRFAYLHAPQLVAHALGLGNKFGHGRFRLLYLWYHVPGEEGCQHERELAEVTEIFHADGIDLRSITYQEVILNLARTQRDDHKEYVDYLVERYL